MRYFLAAFAAFFALPAQADINQVIDAHIMTRHAAFTEQAAALVDATQQDCTPAGMIPAFHEAFDAWVAVNHIRFGPIEQNGESLAVSFWPDKKGKIPKTLRRLIAANDPVIYDPVAFSTYSVAARGFFSLEQLLYDEEFSRYDAQSYTCRFVQAIAADISRIASETELGWVEGYAAILRTAGEAGNEIYLSEDEGAQALLTSLLGGLEYIYAQRVARPLGTFDNPRPARAEARRSARSLRNIMVSLAALQEMARLLSDNTASTTEKAFTSVQAFGQAHDERIFTELETISARFKLETLGQLVQVVHESAGAEISAHLGVNAGFNALDGD